MITILSRGPQLSWAAVSSMVFWMTTLTSAQQIPIDYCSTINTGTGPGNQSDYQSQGLCLSYCKGKKEAFAIVQGNLCWCSNVLPGDKVQVAVDRCRNPCPGFPADSCGSDDTWGYMRIRGNPIISTANPASAATSTDRGSPIPSPVQDSNPPKPVPKTEIFTTTVISIPPQPVASPVCSTLSKLRGGQQQQTQAPPTIETVTADGSTRIITVVPTFAGDNSGSAQTSGSGASSSANDGGGLATGAAVGIAFGVIGILVAGGIAGFMFMRRKRRQNREAQEASMSENHGGNPSTGFATRRPTNGTWGSDHSSGRRSSMPDPRMKTASGFYGGTLVNRSHESFESMQDNMDYSRPVHHPTKVLKVANPSPGEND